MKKISILFLVLIAFACTDHQIKVPDYDVQKLVNGYSQSSLDYYSTAYYNDWSNTVHTIVVETRWTPKQANYGAATVPSDYVLVGGGAYTNNVQPGAYLIGSYPDFVGETWWAFSKDHHVVNSHELRVYAIGLKIDGVSKSTLASNLSRIESGWSGAASHPTASVTVGASYTLLSGGANTSYNPAWAGSLITESYPDPLNPKTWRVKSKDHIYSCPASIKSFAVGVPSTVPGFSGQLEVAIERNTPVVYGNGVGNAPHPLSSGWAPGGVGGQATFSAGRMITTLRPPSGSFSDFYLTTKDLNVWDSGYTYLFAGLIRKKP